jgi:hypothetical protein
MGNAPLISRYAEVDAQTHVFLTRHSLKVSVQLHAASSSLLGENSRYSPNSRAGAHGRYGSYEGVDVLDPAGIPTLSPLQSTP